MTRPTCAMSQEPCDCVVEDPVSVFENEKIADEGNAMALSLGLHAKNEGSIESFTNAMTR